MIINKNVQLKIWNKTLLCLTFCNIFVLVCGAYIM